jgi:VWFA-related protein
MHMQNNRGELIRQSEQGIPPPLQTMLNEVEFERYHLFHADVRVLPGDHEETAVNAAAPVTANSGHADTINTPRKQEVAQNPAPVVAAEIHAPAASDTSVAPAVASAVSVPASAPAVPEISAAATTGLPEPPNSPPASEEKNFTLHVTTRLVDVNVVALDKKGHPVTDLKAQDFEIDDNGRKQTMQFFSQAAGAPTEASAEEPDKHDHAATEPVVFNRRADIADAKPGVEATETSATIILIDANNLAWADLTYARNEILKFLRTLPSGERVGLYVQSGPGFRILAEETADHALLASTLRQWMPSAQVLAQAQEVEQRNRQQFDYVANQSDLQYVNGNMSSTPDTASPVDPQLLDQGSNPGRDALSTLVGIARHLGALPGHKNVVWVASDNVLVDWTDKAVGNDRGGKHIDGFVLRAQEALNDAHASVYPLDVSQLETMAVDPAIKTRNIELSPSVTAPPSPHGGGPSPGRVAAEMQQDLRPVQIAIQEMAKATGGRSFRRSGEIAKELNEVVADGQATYLLGFTPDVPADGQYHRLTVTLTARRGVTLRYRTGYLYAVEPSTLKNRFRQAIWQPFDANDIAVSARPVPASAGSTLKLNIDANDLALRLQDQRWMDKLDIFLVQRDEDGLHARITGQTLSLRLKPATYQSLLGLGIPFDQFIEKNPDAGSVRIVVVDENSGRMGSITLPAAMLSGKS